MLTSMLLNTAVLALEKPNVVLMLADNLGYGDLSVYNGGNAAECVRQTSIGCIFDPLPMGW